LAKKLNQKELATLIMEKPTVIQEYESGKVRRGLAGHSDGGCVAAAGVFLRVNDVVCDARRARARCL
jgi:hypothetical protein